MRNKLFKDTFIFGLALIISQVIGIITLPIIVRQLTISDYGTWGVVTSTAGLLAMLSTLSIGNALFRFGSSEMDEEFSKNHYIISMILTVIVVGLVILIGLSLIGIYMNSKIIIFIAILSFVKAIQISVNNILRVRNKVYHYLLRAIIYSSLYLFGVLFISNTSSLTINTLIAIVIGAEIISAVYGYIVNIDVIQLKHYKNKVTKKMLIFSIPLLGASLIEYLLQYFDIWMLAWLSGTDQAGLFNFAKKFNLVLLMFKSAFFLAWPTIAYRYIDERKHQYVFNILILVMFFVMSLMLVFSKTLIQLLGGNNYLVIQTFLGASLVGTVLGTIGMFLDTAAGISKATKLVTIVCVIGLVIDFIGNYILIPVWGARGAAISTAIAYMSMLVARIKIYSKNTNFKSWTNKGIYFIFLISFISIIYSMIAYSDLHVLGGLILLVLLTFYLKFICNFLLELRFGTK